MSTSKDDIRFIGFNKYIRPEIKVITGKQWVTNGRNNDFYTYLTDRYYGSTTHSSICNSYIDLIYGKGLKAKNPRVNINNYAKFVSLMSKKDVRKVCNDYEIYGEFSVQVIRARNKKDIAQIVHLPKNLVVPNQEDEDGNITSYWYSRDWSKQWKYKPEQFSAFGTSKDNIEIYVGKPYRVGKEYFADPDYVPGLQYAEVEEELSNYYLSHIKNGLSFGTIINVPNSADWSDKDKDAYEKRVKGNTTGSINAGRVVLNFLSGEDFVSIDNVENNTAHKQWDFLGDEARQQLLTAHRATSPSIVGVISSSGFSNTADEMDTAEFQLMKRVISPKQNFITESLEEILQAYNINLDLYFEPLTELPTEDATVVKEDITLCSHVEKKNHDLNDLLGCGEDIDLDEWELAAQGEIDYEEEDKLEFASTGTAIPNAKSSQDGENFIVRYKYVGNKFPERDFCRAMMSADKVYRKEDILRMGTKNVNPGFGMSPTPNAPYSIWLYKGGGLLSAEFPNGTCKHKWNRVIYLKKGTSVDVNSPLAELISTTKARSKGYKIPTNDSKVSIAPHNMK